MKSLILERRAVGVGSAETLLPQALSSAGRCGILFMARQVVHKDTVRNRSYQQTLRFTAPLNANFHQKGCHSLVPQTTKTAPRKAAFFKVVLHSCHAPNFF